MAAESGGELGKQIAFKDDGNLALEESSTDDRRIRDAVHAICAAGDFPLLLGGDHAVTFPILEGIAAHHGPVNILHFDAHPDLYDQYDGNRRSHASPFARIMEAGLAKRLVQVGVRTMNSHCREQVACFGVEVLPMRGFSVNQIPLLDGPLYISVDMDGLDPAFAPGVSHPEPGGLSMREVLDAIDRMPGPVIGADIVECNPDLDLNRLTAFAGAKLVKELAAKMAGDVTAP